MSIKLVLLKSGETLISDVKELTTDNNLEYYVMCNPHKVVTEKTILLTEESNHDSKIQVSLVPWILLTQDDQILVSPDWIVTIVDPIKSVKLLYEEKLNENYQVSFTEG